MEIPVAVPVYNEKLYETIVEVPYEKLRENIIYKDVVIDCDEKDLHLYSG